MTPTASDKMRHSFARDAARPKHALSRSVAIPAGVLKICRMAAEPAPPQTHTTKHESPTPGQPVLHRVCIQCNNMFRVTPENFDAKQCANCHKG